MAWIETNYSKHARKMAAGAFGRARNYGSDGPWRGIYCPRTETRQENMDFVLHIALFSFLNTTVLTHPKSYTVFFIDVASIDRPVRI